MNMKHLQLLFISIACLGVTAVAGASDATISGTVVITRTLTKPRITLPAYQLRGAPVGFEVQARGRGGVARDDEISRVVVYLEGPGLRLGTPVKGSLAQKGRQFAQEVIVVPLGSTVSFPNDDAIFHNVFSLSKAKQFDLGYYPKGQTRVVRFDRAGVVQVYCHIHANMSAAILVAPTAWWTRPSRDGRFSLGNVPPGDYTLVAWHRSAGFFRRHVTVRVGETLKINFTIPVKAPSELLEARSGQ